MSDQSKKDENAAVSSRQRNRRTWWPILAGVVAGLLSLYLVAEHEPRPYYWLTARLFNELAPRKAVEPRTVHFALYMLTLAAIGGSIGALFSEWPKRRSILFLVACLVAIAAVAAIGARLEPYWH